MRKISNQFQEITVSNSQSLYSPENHLYFMSEPMCHCLECDIELYFNEDGYKITDIAGIDEDTGTFCSEECCLRYIREYTRDNCIKQVIL